MFLLKILKESFEELVRDFSMTTFQPTHWTRSLTATKTKRHRKARVKILHFPNLNFFRRAFIVKIPHLLLKDLRERTA